MKSDRLAGVKTLKVAGFLDEFAKDDVKSRVSITALFGHYGVALEKKGKGFMGKCPFHDDANPSLSVDEDKGLFNCFGCGESGDVVSLVQKMDGKGFTEAMEFLKSFGGAPKVNGSGSSTSTVRSRPRVGSISLDDISHHYQKNLETSDEAADYLEARGLADRSLWKRFGFGVSTGNLSDVLSDQGKNRAKELGILTTRGPEFFSGYLTVPLLDESGKVVNMYGRALSPKAKVKHKYLPGSHKGLVNGEVAKTHPVEVTLTESILDAVSLVVLSLHNVIPLYGLNGFTEDHQAALKMSGAKTIVLAFDADDAGRTGADKLAARLTADGYAVAKIFPDGGAKDWNEVLVRKGTKEEVEALRTAAEVLPPTPAVPAPAGDTDLRITKHEGKYLMDASGLSYRILGVRDLFVANLRVNIRMTASDRSFLDNVDLYSARSRMGFCHQAAELLGFEAVRIEKDLLSLVDHLEAERDQALSVSGPAVPELNPSQIADGMSLLTDERLVDRIVEDTTTLGYVGEEVNKVLVYLAATSRKMADPVSVIVTSESASGKSYLIDTVKKLIPPEDVVSMTSLSDQALNYLPEDGLLHKFLVMGEAVHSEAIEHQVREMLSAKELSRLVTMKDPKTGELSSRMVRKEVVVSAVMSTTDYGINPENASRSFLINADESEEQTRAIHEAQRKKYSLESMSAKEDRIPAIVARHHAAQRLLADVQIVNPFAHLLDFPTKAMRTRRDHERFLDLIAAVCFLRQMQKERKEHEGSEYVEADLEDYRIAHRIMSAVLPATLTTFPKSAAELYDEVRQVIRDKAKRESLAFGEVIVTQRELREQTGLSQMFIKRNLRTLVEYEYVVQVGSKVRGARRGYKILADTDLGLANRTGIPTPEGMQSKFQNLQSGSSGSDWVTSGSDPLLRG